MIIWDFESIDNKEIKLIGLEKCITVVLTDENAVRVSLFLFSVPAFADDRLTICSRNQEAALNTLRQSYGAGYGKPIPGSASDKRSAICN